MTQCSLVWFRDDLRLADNPALFAAVETGLPVVALWIRDDCNGRPMGATTRWWFAQSLRILQNDLQKLNIPLIFQYGNAGDILPECASHLHASHVFWNRRYEAGQRSIDQSLKKMLHEQGITTQSFNASLLSEPWELKPKTSTHYKVYTPFWRSLRALPIAEPLPIPRALTTPITLPHAISLPLEALELEPHSPNWAEPFTDHWQAGEAAALDLLQHFLERNDHYPVDRDIPSKPATSSLSPYLRSGAISPRTIWHSTHSASLDQHGSITTAADKFLSELGWRDFCYHQLYHLPDIAIHPVQQQFAHFPWYKDADLCRIWQKGLTGYPLVDAGMRQLWQTGWMHNRVRMVVASFLVKHLRQHWHNGEQWFWDTLLDADPGSNPANWQWVSGCGADASPYFRIFNPIKQSETFDPEGTYIRTYVPELAHVPPKKIHKPWLLTSAEQGRYKVNLGTDYPLPIVQHEAARQSALDAYQAMRNPDFDPLDDLFP